MGREEIIATCHAAAEGAMYGALVADDKIKIQFEHIARGYQRQNRADSLIMEALADYLDQNKDANGQSLRFFALKDAQLKVITATDLPTEAYFEVFVHLYRFLTGRVAIAENVAAAGTAGPSRFKTFEKTPSSFERGFKID